MTEQHEYESEWDHVTVVLDATSVAFRYPDGSTVRVPRNVVSRSQLLQQALEDVQDCQEYRLQLPAGVLQAWLQHVAPRSTVELLKAADFLDDQESMEELCQQIQNSVFSICTCSVAEVATHEAQWQALETLPSHILETVLQNIMKGRSLVSLLKALPPQLHLAAVHAAIPRFIAARHDFLRNPAFRSPTSENSTYKRPAHCLTYHNDTYEKNDEESCRLILMIFKRMSGLFSYDLLRPQGDIVDTWSYEELAEFMSGFKDLKELNMLGAALGPEPVELFASHLTHFTCLELLNVRSNKLFDQGVQALAPHLGSLRTLKTLSLSNNGITQEGMAALAPALERLSALESLDFSHNFLNARAIEYMAAHICRLPCLTHIDLHDCVPDTYTRRHESRPSWKLDSAKSLTCLSTLSALKHIKLGKVDPSSEFLDYLSSLHALERLEFEDMHFSSAAVGQEIARLTNLKHLECDFVNDQYESIGNVLFDASHFSRMTQLTALFLVHGLDREALPMFCSYISSLRSLEVLSLRHNQLHSPAVRILAPELAKMQALKHVDLAHTGIELNDPAFAVDLKGISALTDLQSLNLRGSWLGNSGSMALVPYLKHLSSITLLDLSDCMIIYESDEDPMGNLEANLPEHIYSAIYMEEFEKFKASQESKELEPCVELF